MAGFSTNAILHAKALLHECGSKAAIELLRVLEDGVLGRAEPAGPEAGHRDAGHAAHRDHPAAPPEKKSREWTAEQKAAAAERMRKRWESGVMKGKVGRGKAKKS